MTQREEITKEYCEYVIGLHNISLVLEADDEYKVTVQSDEGTYEYEVLSTLDDDELNIIENCRVELINEYLDSLDQHTIDEIGDYVDWTGLYEDKHIEDFGYILYEKYYFRALYD